jgi:SAM-dependent methyltransferase
MGIENHEIFRSLRENHIPNFRFQLRAASRSYFLPRLCRFINKHLYRFGLGCALNRYDNTFCLYSARADKRLYSDFHGADIFCNFGSGAFFHKRWTNFDYPGNSKYYKTIQGKPTVDFQPIDLCEDTLRLPFADATVSLIYCSHTLEHLEENAARHFVTECCRVLKKGGVLRLVLPSTDNDQRIASILTRQDGISAETKAGLAAQVGRHILSDTQDMTGESVLELLHQAGFDPERFYDKCQELGVKSDFNPSNPERHISFWNYEKIYQMGRDTGFALCVPAYRGSSLAAPFENLCVFDSTEPQISLYTELVK